MGMTIEEAERLLSNYLDGVTNYCEHELTDKAIQVAIETMRKYQKIQEIINNTDYIDEDVIKYKMICEVIEDGKID